MKTALRWEEAFLTILSVLLFWQIRVAWWWFPALLLTPDISMLGYLLGNRVGAWCYNLFHHKATAVVVYGIGLLLPSTPLAVAGVILLAHSSLDRLLLYGLKYKDGFGHTHLSGK